MKMNISIWNPSRWVLIATLFIMATGSRQAAQAQHPVRWTKAVGPPSRQALEAKFRAPVGVFPRSARIRDHNRVIRTCVDYARAKKRGWEAADRYEAVSESIYVDECQTLALVLAAKPSRTSYVKNFKLDEAALDLLPPSLTFVKDPDAAGEAERQGLSWKKFVPGLKIKEKSANSITVLEPGQEDDTARVGLEIKAFGDFNDDGVEDILLSWEAHTESDGKLQGSTLLILTRLAPDGPFKTIELDDAEIERAMTRASQAGTTRPAMRLPPKVDKGEVK
jgi:hypothetical protein